MHRIVTYYEVLIFRPKYVAVFDENFTYSTTLELNVRFISLELVLLTMKFSFIFIFGKLPLIKNSEKLPRLTELHSSDDNIVCLLFYG